MEKKDRIIYNAAVFATTIFMAAVYFLPTKTFFAVFAAGLFLIPVSFFVYLIQRVEGT